VNLALFGFVGLAAIWGASFLFMRIGASEFGAMPLAFGRVAIATAFMLPILLLRGLWPAFRGAMWRVLFIGVTNSAIPFALYSYSALLVSSGFNSIVNATTAMWTSVIAALWFSERLNRYRWAGVFIGFAGVLILFWDKAALSPGKTSTDLALAVCAGLLATICYGFSANWGKKYLQGVPSMVVATGSQLGASIVLAPLAWWFAPQLMPGANAWGSMLALGVLCSGVAYMIYFALMERLGAIRTSMVTYVIPIFGIFWGWALLNETVSFQMLFAMAVTVLGTAMATGLLGPKPKQV
jgi:drug/metabolite transporter (DMT)-like permease